MYQPKLSKLLTIECIEHKVSEANSRYGRFKIGPLNTGQGITVGNSLRRTLLSDITGLAITNAKINVENISGISELVESDSELIIPKFHEFSTIPGVRESVLEILLNLKNIILSDNSTDFAEDQLGSLQCTGPCQITARDLILPETIKVVDPDQYIATMVSNQIFSIKVIIKHGRGVTEIPVQLDLKTQQKDCFDFLTIDATYIPIKKVNYTIEEKFLGDGIDSLKELITLEVWTNGSVKPQKAVSSAINTLVDLYLSIQNTMVV
uniref:Plastid-encoded RNA polymerase subunit alpha n=1 Tax=Eutreptiella pomquetensis TaxID=215699 RepID=A0A223FM74_9EUGL|nr:RNA polymerase alpha subunit [Eutreptiella pomquetensis]